MLRTSRPPCTCAVGLIDHGLNDASPRVNEPGKRSWSPQGVWRGGSVARGSGSKRRGETPRRGLQHHGQRPASALPPGPSPVVDLQDGEPRVLCQLFLLLFRRVRVLRPPERVTLPAQPHLIPKNLAWCIPSRHGVARLAQGPGEPRSLHLA
jgi:hypothetical protein